LRIAVEMRHESCWTDEMRQVLTDREATLVWADRGGSPIAPLWRTADWGYLRLHEGSAQPWPRYRRTELTAWEKRLSAKWAAGQDVYVYFNNDPGGAAIYDAVAFAAIAREAGHTVTGTPAEVPPAGDG
jgi:uncharacterized protein YecE (DUF72 family)